MKRLLTIIVIILTSIELRAQNDFPLGVYLFGENDVDLYQMKDSLILNWVQTVVQNEDGTLESNLLNTTSNLDISIMGILLKDVYYLSKAQRMIFEAEQDSSSTKSYFNDRPDSVSSNEGNFRKAEININRQGYMVQSPVPDNEYHYDQTTYSASFLLKIKKNRSDNPLVCRLEIAYASPCSTYIDSISLYYNDFTNEGIHTFTRTFQYSSQQSPSNSFGVLCGREEVSPQALSLTNTGCKGVDIRVYWYGDVTTSLDKIIVEDTLGKNLFSGMYDSIISNSASVLNGYPQVKRFYLKDEPPISAFLAHDYIKRQLDIAVPNRGTTAAIYHSFERFLNDAKPNELLVDNYPITSDIPSPAMTDNEAANVGIVPYNNESNNYTKLLQMKINNWLIEKGLRPAIESAKKSNKDFWFVPQLHGEYIQKAGQFKLTFDPNGPDEWPNAGDYALRPPTGNEIKMMINLALAYGAKSIIAYPYADNVINKTLEER